MPCSAAAGSRPDTPSISGLVEAGFLTNENVFDLTELPRRLLVIGGGPLGCELAQAFCRFGAQITIAQHWPLFLPREERDAAQLLSDAFARDGIEVRLNTRAVAVRVEGGQTFVDLVSDDYHSTVAVDAILTGTGRVANVDGLNLEKPFTIPMHEVDRAIADGEETGFVKIHVKARTDRILGATIVARHAGGMINEIALAMVAGIGLRTLARVIHACPT